MSHFQEKSDNADESCKYGKWWDNVPYEPVELTLSSGVYHGKAIDFGGKTVEIFHGVRYVQAGRFSPPIAAPDGHQTFDASNAGPKCYEGTLFDPPGAAPLVRDLQIRSKSEVHILDLNKSLIVV